MKIRDRARIIVLAGGDGQRLRAVARDGSGRPAPKQFCRLLGGATLLEETLARTDGMVPIERRYVCVVEPHRPYWKPLLTSLPLQNIIEQPANRGTGLGVLSSVLRVFAHDAHAPIALLPSDHHFRDDRVFQRAVEDMFSAACAPNSPIVLLGVGAEAANTDYGWIVPGAPTGTGTRAITAFLEKPPLEHAVRLLGQGALWSTFVLVARANSLLRLFLGCRDRVVRSLAASALQGAVVPPLSEWFFEAAPIDFSRDVLVRSPGALQVFAVPPCGWTDLGTPERIHEVQERRLAMKTTAASLVRAAEIA